MLQNLTIPRMVTQLLHRLHCTLHCLSTQSFADATTMAFLMVLILHPMLTTQCAVLQLLWPSVCGIQRAETVQDCPRLRPQKRHIQHSNPKIILEQQRIKRLRLHSSQHLSSCSSKCSTYVCITASNCLQAQPGIPKSHGMTVQRADTHDLLSTLFSSYHMCSCHRDQSLIMRCIAAMVLQLVILNIFSLLLSLPATSTPDNPTCKTG